MGMSASSKKMTVINHLRMIVIWYCSNVPRAAQSWNLDGGSAIDPELGCPHITRVALSSPSDMAVLSSGLVGVVVEDVVGVTVGMSAANSAWMSDGKLGVGVGATAGCREGKHRLNVMCAHVLAAVEVGAEKIFPDM